MSRTNFAHRRRSAWNTRVNSSGGMSTVSPAQVELVGDIVKIAVVIGLGRKVFAPIPLVEQFLGERIAIGPAFGIKAGAKLAIPIPGVTNSASCLERAHPKSELAQPVELIEPRNARTDHDGIEIQKP